MDSRIMQIFYGNDCLPYKDSARTVHYPITSGTFVGANNTTKIRFYVDEIGGTENVSWVVVSKLPNGTQGHELLSVVGNDTTLGEKYLEFDLSSFYTQLKGDVYIALNGYQGGVLIEQDEDTGIYTIHGTPTIQVTGSIKIAINYAPILLSGSVFGTDTLQQILGSLSTKVDTKDVILTTESINYLDENSYEEGQLAYEVSTKTFYQKKGGAFQHYNLQAEIISGGTINYDQLETVVGNPSALLVIINPTTLQATYYSRIHVNPNTKLYTYQSKVDVYFEAGRYVVSTQRLTVNANTLTYATQEINVSLYSKTQIDSLLDTIKQSAFILVSVDIYPTLESFLATTGEEGNIYLYPINVSDETQGYYQYTWEGSSWVNLGTTQIDLSGYLQKSTAVNTLYGVNYSAQQVNLPYGSAVGYNWLVQRNGNGQILVPLTPTENNHSVSKQYVDSSFVFATDSEVDALFE